ncbi:MAG: DUF952 domain-containing protein [Anaerolineaceae bacterium]|nr:DUF952 domain-containing protein [Anaerolineaceae bacterium]MBN2676440.1 DUF952 domain-containing protein [Anaerolineaceae bacterium]
MYIYHITKNDDWLKAEEIGSYTAPSLDQEGFIHCSFRHQVCDTARRYYAGIHGLVLLEIDPHKLTSRWINEPSTEEELFPHVYGSINLDAVMHIVPFEPQTDGTFNFPMELE